MLRSLFVKRFLNLPKEIKETGLYSIFKFNTYELKTDKVFHRHFKSLELKNSKFFLKKDELNYLNIKDYHKIWMGFFSVGNPNNYLNSFSNIKIIN